MIESRDKIDLTIRAAMVCSSLLKLTETNSRLHARLIVRQAAQMLMELDKRVEELPKD